MNTQQIQALRADLDDALRAVCEKHGLKVRQGTVGKTADGLRIPLHFTQAQGLGTSDPALARELETVGPRFGLTVRDLGRTFDTHAGRLTLVGMRKGKVVGLRHDGQTYYYEPTVVCAKLRRTDKDQPEEQSS